MSLDNQITVRLTEKHLQIIEEALKEEPLYRTRNEFIRRLIEDYDKRKKQRAERKEE